MIIEELTRELELYEKAAQAAHAEATHEQSRAENKYDTRGLEASYLAKGQSKKVAEIENSLVQYSKLTVRDWKESEPIDIGALVELEEKKQRTLYFVGPTGGGTEVVCNDREITVITPASPLGQELVEKRSGDKVKLNLGGKFLEHLILSVK